MKKMAAIDIGSNSVRSVIVGVPDTGPHKLLDDEKSYTRLSRSLNESGKLSGEAIEDTIAALRRMLQIADDFEVDEVRAVATAAMRRASNASLLVDRAREELGLEIEIISPQEEGRLSFLSAAGGMSMHGRCAVLDIGGGSVEIVRSTNREIEHITSLPLGAVVMTERYVRDDPMSKKDLRRLHKHVRRMLSDDLGKDPDSVHTLVGSGGTINALAAMVAAARQSNGNGSLHGAELTRAELVQQLACLGRSTASERSAMKGLPANRVDIILAGTVVVEEAMRALGANSMVVNTKGMREGIVLDMIATMRGGSEQRDRIEAVRHFGERCNYDQQHATQVCRLSLEIFDQLEPRFGKDPGARALLEAAALLHDVGCHISYQKHHRHSYHLITYSDLPGFTGRQRRMIAGIARYHRGALPKSRHDAMQDLDKADRKTVAKLGGVLRLADGLDRTRSRRISRVEVDDDDSAIRVTVSGEGDLAVEIHGAQNKAALLERALDARVDVVAGPCNEREGSA